MAADGKILQGEVIENPGSEKKDVERLLAGFLRALLDERKAPVTEAMPKGSAAISPPLTYIAVPPPTDAKGVPTPDTSILHRAKSLIKLSRTDRTKPNGKEIR